jgi:RNA polymerase sigma-70 factor (ECF subfamily)
LPIVDADADLVARARAGDYHAFEDLVRRHQGRVYATALGIVKNAAEAEEVSQETFLSAFEHLDGFRGDAKFGTWVFRVATNHALMKLRKKRPEPRGDVLELEQLMRTEGTSPYDALSQWARRPDDAAQSNELSAAINDALDALQEEERIVLLLRAVDDMSHEDMAAALSTTVPAVKSRLHRARLHLRALLNERMRGVLPP